RIEQLKRMHSPANPVIANALARSEVKLVVAINMHVALLGLKTDQDNSNALVCWPWYRIALVCERLTPELPAPFLATMRDSTNERRTFRLAASEFPSCSSRSRNARRMHTCLMPRGSC